MKIRNKMLLIVGIPLLSILLIFIIGLSSFSRIQSTIAQMSHLQNDRATMIDADRDAYQAYLAVLRSTETTTLDQFTEQKESFNENSEQTWTRIVEPGKRFHKNMSEDFNIFKKDYNSWKDSSEAILDLAMITVVESGKRVKAINKSISLFDNMRNNIDILGERVETELGRNITLGRRLELEKALSLILNGDRDAYQAYVAQLQIIDVESYDALISLDESHAENAAQTKDRVNQATSILGGYNATQILNDFNSYFDLWIVYSRSVVDISKINFENFTKIVELKNEVNKSFSSMRSAIDRLGQQQVEQVEIYNGQMISIISSVKITYIIIFIFAVILSATFAFIVASRIITSLQKSIKATEKLSQGDLTVSVDVNQEDEIGDLADSLRGMISNLHTVVNNVVTGSTQIASASSQLAEGNQELSGRTDAQASSLEEISASIEQMNSTIRANADNTITANKLSLDVSVKAEDGYDSVNKMISSMNEINDSSKQIADIMEVINKIAFQTNLLALNASIEAARAGEHGKGFAVVAVEVRKLAKRSDKAAAQISGIIKSSNKKVDEGVSIANTAGKMLSDINSAVKKVTVLVGEISASSQEQLSSVEEIDKTISSLDVNTQKNAALTEEAAAATEELSAQALELNNSMKFFKIQKSETDNSSMKYISNIEKKNDEKVVVIDNSTVDKSGSEYELYSLEDEVEDEDEDEDEEEDNFKEF